MKTILIALGCTLCALVTCAAKEPVVRTVDDFDGADEGMPLDEIDGWSIQSSRADPPQVRLVSGYHGFGVRFYDRPTRLRRELPELAPETRVCEFRFKFRAMANDDAWTGFLLMLGQGDAANDGVNGLAVRFLGGRRDGREDNYMVVSSGGRNWNNIQWRDLPQATWQKERWYEVIISEINPSGVGPDNVAGRLRVVELGGEGASGELVVDEPIGRIGAGPAFTRIDMFEMGSFNVRREVDVDEIELLLCPAQ